MNFKEQLIALKACRSTVEKIGEKTFVDCWNNWADPAEMVWLVRRTCTTVIWQPMFSRLSEHSYNCGIAAYTYTYATGRALINARAIHAVTAAMVATIHVAGYHSALTAASALRPADDQAVRNALIASEVAYTMLNDVNINFGGGMDEVVKNVNQDLCQVIRWCVTIEGLEKAIIQTIERERYDASGK